MDAETTITITFAAPTLVALSLERGFRYGNRIPPAAVRWGERLLEEEGVNLRALRAAKGPDDVLPWDDLEGAVTRDRLWESFLAAQSEGAPGPPPAPAGSSERLPPRRARDRASAPVPARPSARFWVRQPA